MAAAAAAPGARDSCAAAAVERLYLDNYFSIAKARCDLGYEPLFTTQQVLGLECLPYVSLVGEERGPARKTAAITAVTELSKLTTSAAPGRRDVRRSRTTASRLPITGRHEGLLVTWPVWLASLRLVPPSGTPLWLARPTSMVGPGTLRDCPIGQFAAWRPDQQQPAAESSSRRYPAPPRSSFSEPPRHPPADVGSHTHERALRRHRVGAEPICSSAGTCRSGCSAAIAIDVIARGDRHQPASASTERAPTRACWCR